MTPTEIKALRLLKKEGRMKATQFAELMGWPGRSPQGAARNGAGYLARMAKKGLVKIHRDDGNVRAARIYGYYAEIADDGLEALGIQTIRNDIGEG